MRDARNPLSRVLVLLALLVATAAHAVEVRFERIADGVYAFIGETGARTATNEGHNANLGLVVTPTGALLIDSGATYEGARQIHDAVRRVTTLIACTCVTAGRVAERVPHRPVHAGPRPEWIACCARLPWPF